MKLWGISSIWLHLFLARETRLSYKDLPTKLKLYYEISAFQLIDWIVQMYALPREAKKQTKPNRAYAIVRKTI